MADAYETDRVQRLREISCKFHAHAAVGDKVVLGIQGDKMMPPSYRGSARPTGVITRIKKEGREDSTLRVQLDSGRSVDLFPYTIDGGRVWEFAEETWPKVLARTQRQENSTYRGAASGEGEITQLRAQLAELTQRYDRDVAETRNFNNALVESVAQVTGEIAQINPSARFSKTFQEEYRGASRAAPSPFLSDMESDDDE